MPKRRKKEGPRLYRLHVQIASGRASEDFVEKNPVVSRTIEIRGDQTLEDLHEAIFRAFDREDPHMYFFKVGRSMGWGGKGQRYLPDPREESDLDAVETCIEDLGLRTRSKFFYLFDFGDEWWHEVRVAGVEATAPPGKYPREVERVGKSPPQYPDVDDDY